MEKKEAFKRVLETLKNNKSMVEAREDGIYIRLAGKEEKGEAFTLHWGKVLPIGEKSNTQSFAKQELDILAVTVPDAIVTPFANEILALCEAFGKSGQSGGSAPYTASAISQAVKHLMLQEPICPVTGIDDEWANIREVSEDDEMMYQNKRCSGLFKGKSGKCWYIDAIVFKGENGNCFTSGSVDLQGKAICGKFTVGSAQLVKSFPFEPKTFYIDVLQTEWADKEQTEKKEGGGWWSAVVKDEKQLDKAFKYYDYFDRK